MIIMAFVIHGMNGCRIICWNIAAEMTKDKNPLVSIMLDEIGLVLADDIIEAVRKVISILEKCYNQINTA